MKLFLDVKSRKKMAAFLLFCAVGLMISVVLRESWLLRPEHRAYGTAIIAVIALALEVFSFVISASPSSTDLLQAARRRMQEEAELRDRIAKLPREKTVQIRFREMSFSRKFAVCVSYGIAGAVQIYGIWAWLLSGYSDYLSLIMSFLIFIISAITVQVLFGEKLVNVTEENLRKAVEDIDSEYDKWFGGRSNEN
jgi:hypothetical protein